MTEDADDDYVLVAGPEDSEKDDLTKWRRFAIAIAEASKSFAGGLLGGVTIAVLTGNAGGLGSTRVQAVAFILLILGVIFLFYFAIGVEREV